MHITELTDHYVFTLNKKTSTQLFGVVFVCGCV